WRLTDAYPFSVSKLNQFLNLYVIVVWLFLIARTFKSRPPTPSFDSDAALVLSLITLVAILVLGLGGRTTPSDSELRVRMRARRYE
ncbi:MAG: hypothetical protein ACREF4_19970, partial [Gammaproteobacteria bacterium]